MAGLNRVYASKSEYENMRFHSAWMCLTLERFTGSEGGFTGPYRVMIRVGSGLLPSVQV